MRGIPKVSALSRAVAVMVMAAALGGCASVRNELGTANSDCYIAIPAAAGAVHHHGKLRGVRLVTVSSLRPRSSALYLAATTSKRASQVCLIAFGGRFTDGGVSHPIGNETGHVAVVELDYPSRRLLATLIVTRTPVPFGHSHI